MDQTQLLIEGIELMIIGMVMVFAFLVVMIYVMSFSRFFQRFSHLMPDPVSPASPAPAVASDNGAAVALAIAIAERR
jgi:oxaloacetate decarboxylase gamma subunit